MAFKQIKRVETKAHHQNYFAEQDSQCQKIDLLHLNLNSKRDKMYHNRMLGSDIYHTL